MTIWEVSPTGKIVFPTAARLHDMVSTSATDTGTLISTGTVDTGGVTSLIDSSATFVTDGVSLRDAIVNDTNLEHGVVISVVSETELIIQSHRGRGFTENDTYRIVNAGSTGISILHIFGLSQDMEYVEEYVILNGLTAVPTVRTYWRINRMSISGSPGISGCTNEGDITATAAVDGTITIKLTAGTGSSKQAIYTVGLGHDLFLLQYNAAFNKSVNLTGAVDISLKEALFSPLDGGGCKTIEYRGLNMAGSSTFEHAFLPYKKIPELTDIWMEASDATAAGMDVSGGFSGILVKRIQI
ncbi:MAG: hypothetical protein JRC99_00155 [Deltaproteobacteria bacterium]|nr:hypothetical protein [Deltaproteobacteria bacterium]